MLELGNAPRYIDSRRAATAGAVTAAALLLSGCSGVYVDRGADVRDISGPPANDDSAYLNGTIVGEAIDPAPDPLVSEDDPIILTYDNGEKTAVDNHARGTIASHLTWYNIKLPQYIAGSSEQAAVADATFLDQSNPDCRWPVSTKLYATETATDFTLQIERDSGIGSEQTETDISLALTNPSATVYDPVDTLTRRGLTAFLTDTATRVASFRTPLGKKVRPKMVTPADIQATYTFETDGPRIPYLRYTISSLEATRYNITRSRVENNFPIPPITTASEKVVAALFHCSGY